MALTRSGAAHGTDTNPPGSITPNWAINGNGGPGSDCIVVTYFTGGSATGCTVSDNRNTGNYTKIAQWATPGGTMMAVFMMIQQSNAAANSLTISIANTAGNQGQIYTCSFTGFTGIPTFDSTLGEIDNTVATGIPTVGNSNTVFGSSVTSFNNEVLITVNDGDGTQISGAGGGPNDGQGHNWSDFTGVGICYSLIVPVVGSTCSFIYTMQATPSAATYFQLAAIYDKPTPFGTVIQSNSFADTSITLTHTPSLLNPVRTGSALFLVITGGVVSSIVDSNSVTWKAADVQQDGTGPITYIFSLPNSALGAWSATVTLTGAGPLSWWVGEVSGLAPTNILDTVGSSAAGNSSAISAVSQKPALYSTEFLLCAAGYTSVTTPSPNFGLTLDPKGNIGKLAVGYLVSTQSGTTTAGWSFSPNVSTVSCVMAIYVPPPPTFRQPIQAGGMVQSMAQ